LANRFQGSPREPVAEFRVAREDDRQRRGCVQREVEQEPEFLQEPRGQQVGLIECQDGQAPLLGHLRKRRRSEEFRATLLDAPRRSPKMRESH
jgi:hypothetical protein